MSVVVHPGSRRGSGGVHPWAIFMWFLLPSDGYGSLRKEKAHSGMTQSGP